MFLQNLKYSIDDIRLPIREVFLRSTRLCKLSENSHNAAYEFLHNTNIRSVLAGLGVGVGGGVGRGGGGGGGRGIDGGWCGGNSALDIEKGMRLDYKLLKNVYTLTAIYTIDYDNEWQKLLNKQQYNLFEEHGEYILGYLVVHKPLPIGWEMVVDEAGDSKCDHMMNDTPNYIHYIDAMDTRLRGYQLGAFMIKYYETVFSSGSCPNGCIACLPFYVDSSSVVYWRKYLEKHNVFTSDDVHYIIKQYGIYGIVDWELLITEYDTYNISIWRK